MKTFSVKLWKTGIIFNKGCGTVLRRYFESSGVKNKAMASKEFLPVITNFACLLDQLQGATLNITSRYVYAGVS